MAATKWGRDASFAAVSIAVLIASSEARAAECTPPSPACHLANGKQLLKSDPKRAADELLASYKLDERTDTLALYARALERDGRYADALETWQRIIVYRESELDAAKEASRGGGRKAVAAKTTVTKARKGTDEAAEAMIGLWPKIARVRIRIPANQSFKVWRNGIEVDTSRDVLVNAGRDELTFMRKDGSSEKVTVEVAAGKTAKLEAPSADRIAAKPKAAPAPAPAKIAARPPVREVPKLEPVPKPTPVEEEEEATPAPAMQLTKTKLVEEPRSRTMSRVGLVLVGGAVIAGGLAGGLGYLADRDFDKSKDAGCVDGQCPIGPAADLAERSNDRARFAQIAAIGGGAMLVTGITLWVVGRGKTTRRATDVSVRVGASSAALSWGF